MPPARVTTRQMSRQLSPYVQPQAQPGPSHPVQDAIILSEDEGPARKKRAVNARSSRRTNNKARAPPPSASVIEISSDDDDEVPQRRPAAPKSDKKTKALEEVRVVCISAACVPYRLGCRVHTGGQEAEGRARYRERPCGKFTSCAQLCPKAHYETVEGSAHSGQTTEAAR